MGYQIIHNTLSPQQWDAALAKSESPTAYQQSSAYAAAAMALGARIERVAVTREGSESPIALAQFHVKRLFRFYQLALCMRGPIWCGAVPDEEKALIYRMLSAAIKARLSFPKTLLFMPESEPHEMMCNMRMRRVMTGYHTAMLDLTQTEEALLAAQEGKWRNRLRAAQKAEMTITHGGKAPKLERYGWLLEKEAEQSAKVGYAALTPALVPAFQAAAPSGKADNLFYLDAHDPSKVGEPIGAMLFLLHGHSATYHIGWASEAGKAKNVHNVLMWEAMLALKKRKIRWLDLGGVSDDSPGILRFKRGTGTQMVSLPGTYL